MDPRNFLYNIYSKSPEIKSNLKQTQVDFTKPSLLALYEINSGNAEPAKTMLYFKRPKQQNYPIDLNAGYKEYMNKKPWEKFLITNSLKFTLEYLMSAQPQINLQSVDKPRVFTKRGALVEIISGCKFYTKQHIQVSRYDGDLYMINVDDSHHNRSEPKYSHHKQLMKNLFKESLKQETQINDPLKEKKELVAINKSRLGKFELIYQGEFHGIQADEEIENFDDLDALNSCQLVMTKQMWRYLRENELKMFRYWLEAYLSNVLVIYFAYKDKNGIVHQPILRKQTSELAKELNCKPVIVGELLYEFLQKVNDLLTNDNINSLNTVYEFYFDPEKKTVSYKVFKENSEKVFITRDYIEYCKQL